MTLPDVGHAQSSLASSISGTRADSRREGGGVAFAILAEGGAVAGAEGTVLGNEGAVAAGGAAAAIGRRSSCASACSEYGNFIARGSVLKVGVLPRPGVVISARVSVLGAMDGAVTNGAVTTLPGPLPVCPGGDSVST